MNRSRRVLSIVAVVILCSAGAWAQSPATRPAGTTAAIERVRDAILAAHDKKDVDGMLRYVHPDAVIIFPDGRILEGREELRAYYAEMLDGPKPVLTSYTADPKVISRSTHNDVELSYGMMNDRCALGDGTEFGLDSRFSATLVRNDQGPVETGGWMIRSFHSSANVLQNPVVGIAVRKTMWLAGGISLAIGTVGGLIIGGMLRKRTTAARRRDGNQVH